MNFVKFASAADNVKVWETDKCVLSKTVSPHKSPVSSISWSPNGQFFVSCPKNGGRTVVSVETAKGVSMHELPQEVGQTHARFGNSSERYIAACGSESSDVLIWDLREMRAKKSLKSKIDGALSCVLFNELDTHVACGGENGSIGLVNFTSNLAYSPLFAPNVKSVMAMEFNQQCRTVLGTTTDDGCCCLWDCKAWKLLQCFRQHSAPATDIAWSPVNEVLFFTCGLDGHLFMHDTRSKKAMSNKKLACLPTCIDFTADGCHLVVGNIAGGITIHDLRSFEIPIHSFSAHDSPINAIRVLKKVSTPKADLNINNALNKRTRGGSPSSAVLGDKKIASKGNSQKSPFGKLNMQTPPGPQLPQIRSPAISNSLINISVTDVLSPLGRISDAETNVQPKYDHKNVPGFNEVFSSSPINENTNVQPKVTDKKPIQPVVILYPQFKAVVQPPTPESSTPLRDGACTASLQSPVKKSVPENGSCEVNKSQDGSDATQNQENESPDELRSNSQTIAREFSSSQTITRDFLVELVRSTVEDAVQKARDAAHADVVNLHVQMVKLNHRLQDQIDAVSEKQDINAELVKEVVRLNAEIRRLKFHY